MLSRPDLYRLIAWGDPPGDAGWAIFERLGGFQGR
jgi:hypothetical protein